MRQIQNQAHLETMPLLQSVFAFDDNDLIANRYGQITPIQKLHLRDYYIKRKHHKLLVLVIAIIGLIVLNEFVRQELYILVAVTLFGLIGLVTLIITNFLHMRSDKWLDLMDDTAYRVSGIAILSSSRSTSNRIPFNAPPYQNSDVGMIYKLRINDQNFIINSEAFHALVNGSAYSVYYAEKSNPMLSIEPLNNIDQSPVYIPNTRPQMSSMDYSPQKKKQG